MPEKDKWTLAGEWNHRWAQAAFIGSGRKDEDPNHQDWYIAGYCCGLQGVSREPGSFIKGNDGEMYWLMGYDDATGDITDVD